MRFNVNVMVSLFSFLFVTRGNLFSSAARRSARQSYEDVIMAKREMVNTDEAKRWALLMVGATCLSASFFQKKATKVSSRK